MMTFSRRKNVKKDKKKKSSQKDKEKIKSSEFTSLFPQGDIDIKELLERQGCNLRPKESVNRESRLAPSLSETLANPLALAYFMEFTDTKNIKHLVDFWIAVEAFQVVARERYFLIKTYCNGCTDKDRNVEASHSSYKESHGSSSEWDAVDMLQTAGYCQDCRQLQGIAKNDVKQRFAKALQLEKDFSSESNFAPQNPWSKSEMHTNSPLTDEHLNGKINLSNLSNPHLKDIGIENINGELEEESGTGMVQFPSTWQPFSTDSEHDNDVPSKRPVRQSTNYARRFMSKQTRSRTRSTVIDAVGLYARYLSLDADEPICIPSEVRNQIEAEICKDKNTIFPDCFLVAQNVVASELEIFHQEFLESTFGNKYKLFVLQETVPRLQDILYSENSLFYFMEFLDREKYREILEFWLMAESFEQNILEKLSKGTYDVTESVEDAMSLYEKYFSMRLRHQIVKDDKLRIVIENNICREDGPQPNCFCIPVAYAWTALKEVFFPRFLKSDTFTKLVESFTKSSLDSHRNDEVSSTTSSDSRSESIELLSSAATSSAQPDFLDQDIDTLWYRPEAGRLAMGYINEFGVFVPDKEPEQFQDGIKSSSVSKLGKAMKNLLSKESGQDKERLAWEKARKIIEDIQRQSK